MLLQDKTCMEELFALLGKPLAALYEDNELSGNLTGERERFEKEFLKAGNDGCKVYLIVEVSSGYSDIIGHKYRTEFTPAAYMAFLRPLNTDLMKTYNSFPRNMPDIT